MGVEIQSFNAQPRESVHISRSSDTVPSETPSDCSTPGFLGAVVRFDDGSSWKMTKALSHTKYQQGQPPFEARQVFECVCVDDPDTAHTQVKEAVAKVKYQVQGTSESIFFFWDYARQCKNKLSMKLGTEDEPEAHDDFKEAKALYQLANCPATQPHSDTIREAEALENFGESNCKNAPRLLASMTDYMPNGFDEQAIAGGYVAFMLMNKVPVEPLNYETFWKKDEATREEIRRAFKVALIEVWKCSLMPHDSALRNLIWDAKDRKCYIVDFEEYSVMFEHVVPAETWKDTQYEYWGLAEKCRGS